MRILALVIVAATALATQARAMPKDSLTVESKSARGYVVLHKVDAKETWFSVARRYGASATELRKANPDAKDALSIGQIIRVPVPRELAASSQPKPVPSPSNPLPRQQAAARAGHTHTVVQGEGLFAIARKYNLKVDDLKRWNNLTDNNVKPGQVLVVEAPKDGASAASAASKTSSAAEPVRTMPIETATARAGSEPEPAAFTNSGFDMVKESGMADLIDDERNGKKHLALHKTAPAGTIVKVRNELNGTTVFVRVIGKLPETGPNDQVIVRLSKRAYERLTPSGRRVPVEVSYPAP